MTGDGVLGSGSYYLCLFGRQRQEKQEERRRMRSKQFLVFEDRCKFWKIGTVISQWNCRAKGQGGSFKSALTPLGEYCIPT